MWRRSCEKQPGSGWRSTASQTWARGNQHQGASSWVVNIKPQHKSNKDKVWTLSPDVGRCLLLVLSAHSPQVVVFLLLNSPDHPLVVAWALGIDLNGHQLETGRQLHLGLEDLLTCPVGWLLKSLKPESFGDLITTITKASLQEHWCTSQLALTLDHST